MGVRIVGQPRKLNMTRGERTWGQFTMVTGWLVIIAISTAIIYWSTHA